MAIKHRLNRLTGVQRVFLVCFVISWGYFALWESIKTTASVQRATFDFNLSVDKDLRNPLCEPYANKPIAHLSEPKFSSEGGSCWHIYTYRKNRDQTLPLTSQSYYASRRDTLIAVFAENIGGLTTLVVLAFALIFLVYKILLWIVAGFRK